MGTPRFLVLIVPLVTLGLLHIAILMGRADLTPAVLALAGALHLGIRLLRGGRGRALTGLVVAIATLAAIQGLALQGYQDLAKVVLVPPVIVHAAMAWMFGRTLLPGREPLIRRFSRFNRGTIPAELEGYTRRLTALWTAMFALMGTTAAILAATAEADTWSWWVNIAMPAIALAVFLGDHAYRSVAYAHLGHNSPIATLRTLLRPETWTAP